jgi:hypothetical protein
MADSLERFLIKAVMGIFSNKAIHTALELSRTVGMCSRTNPKIILALILAVEKVSIKNPTILLDHLGTLSLVSLAIGQLADLDCGPEKVQCLRAFRLRDHAISDLVVASRALCVGSVDALLLLVKFTYKINLL